MTRLLVYVPVFGALGWLTLIEVRAWRARHTFTEYRVVTELCRPASFPRCLPDPSPRSAGRPVVADGPAR